MQVVSPPSKPEILYELARELQCFLQKIEILIEQFQNHGNQKLRNGHTQIAMFLYQTVSCCKLNSSLNSCQDLLIRK